MAPVLRESLAQWFNAGYAQDNGNFSGKKTLPDGYTGADSENLFIKTKVNGVVVWPVRLDLGETSSKSNSCTLYHYTHRKSLVACSEIFSQTSEASVKEVSLRLLLQLLREDCQARSTLDPRNPHAGKLLMTPLEPAQFDTQADVLHGIFGSIPSKKVRSLSGEEVAAKEIARCCIAIRIPVIMCSKAKLSGSQSEAILVNTDRLDREIKQLIASQEQKAKEDKMKDDKKKCCFPWPFGRKSEQSRSRSKSQQGRESKEESKPLITSQKSLKDLSQAEINEQKRRRFKVEQMEAELLKDMTGRVQMQNRYDNLISAVHESKGSRSKSIGKEGNANLKKRMSLANAHSSGSASTKDKSEKGSKMAVDLSAIVMQTANSSPYDTSTSFRLDRSECSATIKAKGGWQQLARRRAASEMLEMQ